MLHRSVTLVHGSADAWSDPEESRAPGRLARRAPGRRPGPAGRRTPATTLRRRATELIGELADDLAARLLPRDLPPVLVAIEEMG